MKINYEVPKWTLFYPNLARHARHVTSFQVWMENISSHTIATYQVDLPTI